VKVGYARLSRQHRDLVLRRQALGAARAQGKGLSWSWRFAHPASLLTMAIVLCLGAFLFYSATVPKSEASAVLTTAGATYAEQAANDYGRPIDGNYLAVSAEGGDLSDELPPNAALLTALVRVVFYGTVLGRLLAFARTRRSSEVSSLVGRRLHPIAWLHQRRTVAALLGVLPAVGEPARYAPARRKNGGCQRHAPPRFSLGRGGPP
jgi:hypothetical protein